MLATRKREVSLIITPPARTDLANAGAILLDQPAVTDGNIVTSRMPEDVEAFTDALIALIER